MPVGVDLTGSLATVVENLTKSISKLDKELSENLKLEGAIIEQVKKLFTEQRSKF